MGKKLLTLIIGMALLIAALPLAAAAEGDAPQAKPKPAVGGQLNLLMPEDPTLHPLYDSWSPQLLSLIYASLFEINEHHQPTPYVAKSWKTSEDGKTWTIHLREDVRFHDGNALTADDVVYTIGTAVDPNFTGYRDSKLMVVTGVSATDKYTVQITLREPFASLPLYINFGIVEKKLFTGAYVADLATHRASLSPVGAGPYLFVEHKKDAYVTLRRNPNWWMSAERNGAPFIESIRFFVGWADQSAQTGAAADRIDVLDEMATPPTGDAAKQFVPVHFERLGFGQLVLNTRRSPLDDARVRRALTMGLDRQAIVDEVLPGAAVVPPGLIPSSSWAFDSSVTPLPFDVTAARALLEQAGYIQNDKGMYYKNGAFLRLRVVATFGSTSLIDPIIARVKSQWGAIGVEVATETVNFTELLTNRVRPGNFDVAFLGLGPGRDPDLYPAFHSSQVSGANYSRYASPRMDRLLEAGRSTVDAEKRKAVYASVQTELVQEAPVIPLYQNRYTAYVNKRLKGVVTLPGIGPTFIERWWIEEKAPK